MKKIFLDLLERIFGRRGWILTCVGLLVSFASIYMWTTTKIDTTEFVVSVSIAGTMVLGKLPEKK